ncbi:unnamed protein product [Echinostoma caproni]|uniref:Uncharacterized protein n=1 Tax=Echinostoma caproni TaxID=27848 RepID=A0A3P8GQQ7_9TREM|nr:unnamed protein product [Echinostoma caproni]
MTVLEPVEPVIDPRKPRTFTCVLLVGTQTPNAIQNETRWLRNTTKGLELLATNKIRVSVYTKPGVYQPRCVSSRIQLDVFKEINFFVYLNQSKPDARALHLCYAFYHQYNYVPSALMMALMQIHGHTPPPSAGRAIMLVPEPRKPFYVFGENTSVSFRMAYIDAETDLLTFMNRTDLSCLIRAPMYWEVWKNQSPFYFRGNLLALNVSETFRYSGFYRVQCQLFDGTLDRNTEIQLINPKDVYLEVIRPEYNQHSPNLTGNYECLLVGKIGLDLYTVKKEPVWKQIRGSYVNIINNTLVVDKDTGSGQHEVECVYEEVGIRLNHTVRFTYFRESRFHAIYCPIALVQFHLD